ncbi:MAG TPA: rod shape-determining protein, partial [Candidatus Limiplasma sp.]|nr:rod shape-determining protein [Candidatus Limiplasma sp.]
MGFAAHDLGIDLGTSNTLVYVGGKNIVVNEPTIVVVESTNERRVRAVGDDAKIMLGRTTEGVMAIRPMREGVITDFDMTRILLQYFTRKAIGSSYLLKPRLFLTYPCSISSIEQRAVMEAAKCAGGRKIFLVEKPFASALGSGLPVFEPNGCMIVDIGGGTTDVSVISLGGVVLSHSIRVGGVKMDEAIINFIKREFNILIGDRTAEEVKLDLGAALPIREERRARIRGRDMVTNLPQTTEITSTQIYQAIHEPCLAILSAIKWVLERAPPELAADVMHNGI